VFGASVEPDLRAALGERKMFFLYAHPVFLRDRTVFLVGVSKHRSQMRGGVSLNLCQANIRAQKKERLVNGDPRNKTRTKDKTKKSCKEIHHANFRF